MSESIQSTMVNLRLKLFPSVKEEEEGPPPPSSSSFTEGEEAFPYERGKGEDEGRERERVI